jgi:hypothetical protein
MKRGIVSVVAVAAAVAAFWPAAGSAAGFRGIVVAKQHGSLLVASPSGALRLVHARASIGARLVGTIVVGRATHARIHGIVVRRIGTTLVLSSNRHLIAIPNRVGRRLADTTPTPTTTAPGAVVNADVVIKNGQIEEEDEDEVGQVNAGTLTIQATVKAVAPGSVTLDVQGQSVTVPLPAGLTLPASLVGQTVTLTVRLDDDDQGDNDDHGDDHHSDRSGHGDGGGDD